jgi:hypothetical protein
MVGNFLEPKFKMGELGKYSRRRVYERGKQNHLPEMAK